MIMKKVLAFAVLALTVLSCSKEIAEQQLVPAVEKSYTSFTATGEEISKVALDFAEEQNVKWEDADQLAVFDGSAKNIFSIKAGSNTGASAVFEGEVSDGVTTLYAVYPASAGEALEGTDIKVSVPAAQTIPSGAFADPKALVAVASASKGSPMEFKQVCGLLKISFTASNIREITITGKAIAGAASVGADGVLKSASAASDAITLTHADGIFPAGTYYVPVLPGTTPAGSFSISLIKGASTAERTATGAITFERRKGVDAGSLDKLPTTTVIRTMAELFEWNANRVGGTEDNVIIGADIDMENEPWVPKDFTGTFDGQGHKLYNLSVKRSANACFVNTLDGTIKDVTFGTSNGTSYDGQSVIIQNNPDDTADSGWRYAGLVTRLSADAVLENITSYVPVTVASTSKSKTRIGGLVAIIAGASSVKNCHNYGAVSNEATAPVAAGVVGGLIGWTDATVTVEDCSNSGNVTVGSASTSAVGGLIGFTNSVVTVADCSNSGKITVNNATTAYIGGILSSDEKGGSFTNCVNSGNIDIPFKGNKAMCVGGILGDATKSTVTGCSNSGAITSLCDGELKVGGIVGRAYTDGTIVNCTNEKSGTITFNPDTFSNQAFIGGILGNAPKANAGTLKITNCTNNAPLSSTHRNVAIIAGILGYTNMTSGTIAVEGCNNFGAISRTVNETNAGFYTHVCPAGISSKPDCKSGSFKNCNNYGKIYSNTNAEGSIVRMAGIVAWAGSVGPITFEGCENSAEIEFKMGDGDYLGSYLCLGGVAGHIYKGSVVRECANTGNLSSNCKNVNRMGGIVGTCNSSAVYDCTNEGVVEVNVPSSTEVKYWQAIGGIVGFAEGTSTGCTRALTGCANRAQVKVSGNFVPNYVGRCAVGGIIGAPYSAMPIENNANYSSVTAVNTNATTPWCFVGGICGMDIDGDSRSAYGKSEFSGNANYGAVSETVGNAAYAAAGGLFGWFGSADSASGSMFGKVSGNAGAVAGKNTKAITATICDAVTVNGVAKAAAADEAAWLCPSNTGTITPTYVAHSDSE